jgi:hypothetical protein
MLTFEQRQGFRECIAPIFLRKINMEIFLYLKRRLYLCGAVFKMSHSFVLRFEAVHRQPQIE